MHSIDVAEVEIADLSGCHNCKGPVEKKVNKKILNQNPTEPSSFRVNTFFLIHLFENETIETHAGDFYT